MKVVGNLILTLLLLVIGVTATFVFNRATAPEERPLPVDNATEPDYGALIEQVRGETLQQDLETLCASPSRFTGTPGCDAAADYIVGELKALGFHVSELPTRVGVPLTRTMVADAADGRPLPEITVHPLIPNWFRTVTTPEAGIDGTVVRVEKGQAQEFTDVPAAGNIVLLPLGRSWDSVAGLGAAAVLYFDDGETKAGAGWAHHRDASVNMPRFIVTGDAAALAGRRIRLQARVDFVEVEARTLIAQLPAADAEEAVVVGTYYDSYSYAPDLAPGAGPAAGIATFLATARQLAVMRDRLRRSVVLVAEAGHGQGLAGMRELSRAVGNRGLQKNVIKGAQEAVTKIEARLEVAQRALTVAEDAAYWAASRDADNQYWEGRERKARHELNLWYKASLDVELMAAIEDVAQARIHWIRGNLAVRGEDGEEAAVFTAYNSARRAETQVEAMLGTPLGEGKKLWEDQYASMEIATRVPAFGRGEIARLERDLRRARQRLRLSETMVAYKRVQFVGIDVTVAPGEIGVHCGDVNLRNACLPLDSEIMAQLQAAGGGLDAAAAAAGLPQHYIRDAARKPRARNLVRATDERELAFVSSPAGSKMYFQSAAMLWAGHGAFSLSTTKDARKYFGTPFDTLARMLEKAEDADDAPIDVLTVTARITAAAICRLAGGHGQFVGTSVTPAVYNIRGQVVSRVGDSLTPDHPMGGAVVRMLPALRWSDKVPAAPGMSADLYVMADANGDFEFSAIWGGARTRGYRDPVSIDAAVIEPQTGAVMWTLSEEDSGGDGAFSVSNVLIKQFETTKAMPVLFRAAAIQVVPMSDPATLAPYAAFELITSKGMSTSRLRKVEKDGSTYVCFVPPETEVFFTFKKGSMTNPNVTTVRAFALGADGPADGSEITARSELVGDGYMAADHPAITGIELDVAISMAQVNSRRLRVQDQYKMADEMSLTYNAKAVKLAEEARAHLAEGRRLEARQAALNSVAYSTNVHPVVRQNASDAIWGILFYLLLALPFTIFLEKLLVGHGDIRGQLCWQGVFFLVFFFLLRAMHPAYELVRSSYMILLGFISFALAAMVSIFVSVRFGTNVRELQRKLHGQAEVLDVSRAGAAATAFLLGLGHMRRRRVRTGLTAGTLVLTTFVMLCFASVKNDVADIQFALGKAPYSGMFIRSTSLGTVESSLSPLQERYGRIHLVAPRRWKGTFVLSKDAAAKRAEIDILRKTDDREREATVSALLGLSAVENQITPVADAFVQLNRWFETDNEDSCYLPQPVADELGLTREMVAVGDVTVTIDAETYTVLGIFDPAKFDTVLDLDGEPMLPLDVLGLMRPGMGGGNDGAGAEPTVPENIDRLPAETVAIVPSGRLRGQTTASVAVAFKGTDYAVSKQLINSHLERSAELTYYGIDGYSYYGGKLRRKSVTGLLDLALPLIIAILTVYNTMNGSVHERHKELYVFNAVGLSPTHIRWLFLAEGCVYGVIGVVGGYLLAQGTGTVLRVLEVTGGLTMNYSSMSGIVVSILIMVAVLVSSLIPAYKASKLAAPAESMSRARHTASGDMLEIDLPFTFNHRDRVAIVPYFIDWFENYGEGSAGEYYCSPPQCSMIAEEHGGAAPCVRTTTWLKPYDLGVSQEVEVVVRHHVETGDNVATIRLTRKSGDVESWERCCHSFIGLLRKRFLTWRDVGDDQRDELLGRGRDLLEAAT
jgi:hypothetical protein